MTASLNIALVPNSTGALCVRSRARGGNRFQCSQAAAPLPIRVGVFTQGLPGIISRGLSEGRAALRSVVRPNPEIGQNPRNHYTKQKTHCVGVRLTSAPRETPLGTCGTEFVPLGESGPRLGCPSGPRRPTWAGLGAPGGISVTYNTAQLPLGRAVESILSPLGVTLATSNPKLASGATGGEFYFQ